MPKDSSHKYSKDQQKALEELRALSQICKSQEYQNHLKPRLAEAFTIKWLDPSQATNLQEFHKQYSEIYGRAMAYKEIYDWIETAEKTLIARVTQFDNAKKGYGI